MGRRNSHRDDGLLGVMIDLAREGVELAGELSPMKGLAVGAVLAIALCVIIPAFLHLFTNTSSPLDIVIGKIADLIGTFAKFIGVLGALACVMAAAKNLISNWRYESNAGAQLVVVIASCLGFCLYLFSLLPANFPQVAPMGAPAQGLGSGDISTDTPTSLTQAVSVGVSRAVTSLQLPGIERPNSVSTLFSINANVVQIQNLDHMGLKVVKDPRCEPFVDMLLAAQRSSGYDSVSQTRAKVRVSDALKQGWAAQCFIEKTAEEKLPVGLRMYWQNNSQRLLQTGQCANYSQWARDTVFTNAAESERQYQLSRLFADAQAHHCMQ